LLVIGYRRPQRAANELLRGEKLGENEWPSQKSKKTSPLFLT
jgi:hypothetical protein